MDPHLASSDDFQNRNFSPSPDFYQITQASTMDLDEGETEKEEMEESSSEETDYETLLSDQLIEAISERGIAERRRVRVRCDIRQNNHNNKKDC